MKQILYYLILAVIVVLAVITSLSIMMAVFGFEGKWVSAFTAGIALSIIYGRERIFILLDKIFKRNY